MASAIVLADSLPNSKLVVFTLHGRMARYTSNLRSQRAAIFAFTPMKKFTANWRFVGELYPFRIDFGRNAKETIALAEKFLRRNKLGASGNRMVIVGDVTVGFVMVDSIQLRVLK